MRGLVCVHETKVSTRGSDLCEPSSSSGHSLHRGHPPPMSTLPHQRLIARSLASTTATLNPANVSASRTAWLYNRSIRFNPDKLEVTYLPGAQTWSGPLPLRRCYTLTHNDITGALQLSVGSWYNKQQLSNWYLQLLRDEVLAEWDFSGSGAPTLHVHCHVSGAQFWLASPHLRKFIFEKEMPLVLKTIRHGDHCLMSMAPALQDARVVVHFQSHMPELHSTQDWGMLGHDGSWPAQGAPPWLLPLQFLLHRVMPRGLLPQQRSP